MGAIRRVMGVRSIHYVFHGGRRQKDTANAPVASYNPGMGMADSSMGGFAMGWIPTVAPSGEYEQQDHLPVRVKIHCDAKVRDKIVRMLVNQRAHRILVTP